MNWKNVRKSTFNVCKMKVNLNMTFLTIIWVELPPSPVRCWFSLNNSETVKPVTLIFCIIQQHHFIIDICVKFGILNSLQSPDIGQIQTGVFPVSGFLLNPLSQKIDITPEPAMILTCNLDQQLKLKRQTKQSQKKLNMTSCCQFVTSLSFLQFMANLELCGCWTPDA